MSAQRRHAAPLPLSSAASDPSCPRQQQYRSRRQPPHASLVGRNCCCCTAVYAAASAAAAAGSSSTVARTRRDPYCAGRRPRKMLICECNETACRQAPRRELRKPSAVRDGLSVSAAAAAAAAAVAAVLRGGRRPSIGRLHANHDCCSVRRRTAFARSSVESREWVPPRGGCGETARWLMM